MIVAFCGQAGTGKTTAAGFIVENAPPSYKVERFSFAAVLKQAASLVFGPTLSDRMDEEYRGMYARPPAFYGTQAQKNMPRGTLGGGTGREFLQEFGTLCREYNEDVFLNHLTRSPGVIQVVDDLRYRNEAARVQKLGGIVVGLRVHGEEALEVGHPSEVEMVEFWKEMVTEEWVLERGALGDFETRCRTLLAELPARRAR